MSIFADFLVLLDRGPRVCAISPLSAMAFSWQPYRAKASSIRALLAEDLARRRPGAGLATGFRSFTSQWEQSARCWLLLFPPAHRRLRQR
jgi:hypothetical protein